MGIQMSGFNSGLPVEDIIRQLLAVERRPIDILTQRKKDISTQQGLFANVKTRVSDLFKSLETLTKRNNFLGEGDLFFSKKVTSSNADVATATVNGMAANQTFSLEVLALATPTSATSLGLISDWADANTLTTKAAMGGITSGTFTVFKNGVANTINVAKDGVETLDDVLDQISALDPTISTEVLADGKVRIRWDSTQVSLGFGAAGDASNFLSATHLLTGSQNFTDPADYQLTGRFGVLAFNPNEDITTAATSTPVAAGSEFRINGVSFEVGNKSLNQIIREINNSSANVTASFDPTANRFKLISKTPGSEFIALSDTAGNFLEAMRLIDGGNSTNSQSRGVNAQFRINGGETLYSSTNTARSEVTGLTGVTLNLKKADVGNPITITVDNDTEKLTGAIDDFIKKMNDTISYIDFQTKADPVKPGPLAGESSLKRLRQQLRQMVTDVVSGLTGEPYNSLQTVGISTGAPSGTATFNTTLQFDKAKFAAALEDDFDNVYQLFKATTAADGFDGTMTRMKNLLDAALETASGSEGVFAAYETTVARRKKNLDEAIERGEDRLASKEKILRQQFLMMERMIAQFQQQGNALAGLQQQLSANSRRN
jgi:flagellar hook-associated protein 2